MNTSMNYENQLQIGVGIYTTTDIATILEVPITKVGRWIRIYLEKELGKEYQKYSIDDLLKKNGMTKSLIKAL